MDDTTVQNNCEQLRLDSFRNWTKTFTDPKKLAMYGFFYKGPEDVVKCNFCKVEIERWSRGDNALVEHLKWSPNCPLLRRQPTLNIPLNKQELETNLSLIPVQSQLMTKHPDYVLESERLKSFAGWPEYMKQKPKELAEAGFFYMGKDDQVKCFSCGGCLKDWEDIDEPWEQHTLYYAKCPYLKKNNNKPILTP